VKLYISFSFSRLHYHFPLSQLIMGSIVTEDLQQTGKPTFPGEAITLEYAKSLDSKDHLRLFRQQFKIPSKSNIKSTKVVKQGLPHYSYPSFHVTLLTWAPFRTVRRPMHLLLRKLFRSPASSSSRIYPNPPRHLVNDWCAWSFSPTRRLPALPMATTSRACRCSMRPYCWSVRF
jgi:hypothetical protein